MKKNILSIGISLAIVLNPALSVFLSSNIYAAEVDTVEEIVNNENIEKEEIIVSSESEEEEQNEEVQIEVEETVEKDLLANTTELEEKTTETQIRSTEVENKPVITQLLTLEEEPIILPQADTRPVVTINTPLDTAFLKGNSIAVNVTAIDDVGMSSYYIRLWKDAPYVYNGGTLVGNCQQAPGGTNLGVNRNDNCIFNVTGFADDQYFITAQYLDSSTQWGVDQISVYLDNTVPTLSNIKMMVNGVESYTAKSGDSIRILADATDNLSGIDKVQLWVRDYPYTGRQITAGQMSYVSGDTYEFNFTMPETYSNGEKISEVNLGNYFNFRPWDKAGNSLIGYRVNFTLDNVPAKPVMTKIVNRTTGDVVLNCGNESTPTFLNKGYTSSTQIRIEWDLNSESDISGYYFGTKINPKHRFLAKTIEGYNGSMTPGNNPYYYSIIAVDNNGNESEITYCGELILDQTAPAATIIEPIQNDVIAGDYNFEAEIIEDAVGKVTFEVFEGCYEESNNYLWDNSNIVWSDEITSFDALQTGTFNLVSGNFNSTSLGDGVYTVRVLAEDKAGNRDPQMNSGEGVSVDVECFTIKNINLTPEVEIVLLSSSTSILVGQSVNLGSNVINGGDLPYILSWECTNGQNGTGVTEFNPTFSSAGTYTCKLMIADANADSFEDTITINVSNPPVVDNPPVEEENNNGGGTQTQNNNSGNILGIGNAVFTNNEEEVEEEGSVLGDDTCSEDIQKDVSGFLFIDSNNNNSKDENESGINNKVIIINTERDFEEVEIDRIATNEDGEWKIKLCPGEYTAELFSNLSSNQKVNSRVLTINVSDEDVLNKNFVVTEVEEEVVLEETTNQFPWWIIVLLVIALLGIGWYIKNNSSKESAELDF